MRQAAWRRVGLRAGLYTGMERFRDALAKNDLFRFKVGVSYEPAQHSSKRSQIASAAVIVLTAVYFAITVGRFLNVVPVIKTTQRQASRGVNALPPVAITAQYGASYDKFVLDPSLVRARLFQGKTFGGNSRRDVVEVATSPCTVGWASARPVQGFCADEKLTMLGQLASDEFHFVQFELVSNNKTGLLSLAPPGGLRIFVYILSSDDEGKSRPTTLFYYPIPGYTPRAEVIFAHVEVTTTANFITTFVPTTKSYVSYVREKQYLVASSGDASPNNTVFLAWFRMDDFVVEEERRLPTLFDAVGSIGALFSALVSIMGLYFLHHNAETFYLNHEDWRNVPVSQAPHEVELAGASGERVHQKRDSMQRNPLAVADGRGE